MLDHYLNELRGSIGTHLQDSEWTAIRYFGEQCSQPAAFRRIATLQAETERLTEALSDIANYPTGNPGDHAERARAALAPEVEHD